MGSKANDYLESLFTGIDTLIDKKLESVSFDTTIICTVTDDSNSMNGEYIVTDGSVSYTAYSDVDSYLVGNQVRVSIPMGDFSQKKFIVGKYVSDNDSNPITYISPADTILSISGNLTENVKGGIVANGTDTSRVLWNQSFGNDFIAMQSNDIYNTIVLKADFRTMLSNYDLISGNYGLRLDFLVRPSAQSLVKIKRSVELDSSEMFGNPYSFSIRSPQSKIFKINTIGIIEAIELSIYQKGNFLSRNNGPIVPFVQDDNIFVDNIVLGLGCDLATTEDNKVQIYTENDTSYLYGLHNNTTNLKTIGLLWLNKDDNNQYIGFSDGIYDYDYDELDYLDKSTADARLMAQKGRENIPMDKTSLELAANIEEAVPAILNAVDVVNKDLIQVLRQFRSAVDDVISFSEHLDLLLNYTASDNNKRYLVNITDTIKTKLDNSNTGECGMVQQYADILKYGFQTWKGQTKTPTWASKASLWEVSYGADIANCFELIRTHIAWLLDTSSNGGFSGIDSAYSGYKSIYDNYKTRIERIMATMNGYLGQGDDLYKKPFPTSVFDGDYDKLMEYEDKAKTSYKLYKSPDLTAYDNKYCIYWYRYEKDYTPPVTESFMPNNWRRLTPNELKGNGDSDGINVGLSSQYKDKDGNVIKNDEGKPLHAPKPANGKGIFTRYMQNDLEQEKYIAILFYNHNMYKSNELVFTNSEVVPDKTTLDKGDILIFEHLTNSSDDFQSYAITNYLMDASDETRERQIRCHYDGLLAKDNAFINGSIYWYVPAVATMLNVDIDDLVENKGFTLDASRSKGKEWKVVNLEESNREYVANKYYIQNANGKYVKSTSTENPGKTLYEQTYTTYCFYKQITAVKKENADNEIYEWDKWDYANGTKIDNRDFWYKIQPFYDASATNNSIKCVFIKYQEDDEVQGEQFFTFGVKGTSGTKYTLAITKPTTQKWVTASKGLSLKAQLKDFNNSLMNFGENLKNFRVEWECYKTVDRPTDIAANVAWPNTLTVQNLNTQTTEANFNTHKGVYGILRASGEITLQGTEIAGESETEGRTRQVNMNVLCSVPYSSGDYYLRGPTEIIYNSLGTIDSNTMFNTPYSLLATKDLTIDDEPVEKDTPIPGVVWSLVYYVKKNDGNKLADREWDALTSTDNRYKFYSQYMPKISNTNNLVPAPIYLENLDCYAVLFAKRNGTTLWRQPIIILQNRYASSMLNDWDGSLTIDEKNGTILSSMVGAGRKTDNNTFEGVLMGDVALGTGSNIGFENGSNIGLSNQTGLGLYGFHDGAQSFGFNIDGTAFLGKSGKGRIVFNGNHGTIASANWYTGSEDTWESDGNGNYTYPKGGTVDSEGKIETNSNAGMCIDLDSGQIDAYNFKLTSNNIYLNSSPGNGHIEDSIDSYENYYVRIGEAAKTGYIGLTSNGELEIRVNRLQITGTLGNENLLKHTSPRKTVLVPHWNETANEVTTAYEDVDSDGNPIVVQTKEYSYVESKCPADKKEPVYIYNLAAWNKRIDQEEISKTTWDYKTAYKANACVNAKALSENAGGKGGYQGNIWKNTSGKTITAYSNPPGNNNDWTPYINVIDTDDKKPYILDIYGDKTWITQSPLLKRNTEYTVSGYVRIPDSSNIEKNFTIILGSKCEAIYSNLNDDNQYGNATTFFLDTTSWYYFRCTFKTPDEAAAARTVGFTCEKPFQIWHAKLEEGSVATAWCPAPDDQEENVESTTDKYDTYLAQDKVFEKLFTDSRTGLLSDGIQLLSASETLSGRPELYISATYMATGILRSKNWDGKLQSTYNNGVYDYTIKTHPTQGMYINLNEGKIWAAKFELNAWDANNKGLYLNSHPSDANVNDADYYLKIGDLNNNYITFSQDGKLLIRANEFSLLAPFGGSNLLHQTSPRKNTIVYHWLKTKTGDNREESDNGVTSSGGSDTYYKSEYQSATNKTIIYTWTIGKWKFKDESSTDITGSAWAYNTKYETKDQIVKHHNTLWKASSNDIGQYANPPGNNNKWLPYLDVIDNVDDKPYILSVKYANTRIYQSIPVKASKKYTLSGYVKLSTANKNFTIVLGSNCTVLNCNLDHNVDIKTDKNLLIENTDWHYFECTFESKVNDKQTVGFIAATPYQIWHAKLEEGNIATDWSMSDDDVAENAEAVKDNYNVSLNQDKVFNKLFKDPISGQMSDGIQLIPGSETLSGRPELYINATYIATGILRSKNWDGKLQYKYNSTTKKFEYSIKSNPTSGMYINLDAGKIWAATFELDAWIDNAGLYLNSSPSNGSSYFRVGKADNELRYYLDNNGNSIFKISATQFALTVGTAGEAGYIRLNSDTSKDSKGAYKYKPLVIGEYFSVDWNGKLNATNAIFSGEITAKSGDIGGWTINETSLSSANVTLSSNTTEATNKAIKVHYNNSDVFYVRNNGYMYASSGSIGGWNISSTKLSKGVIELTNTGTIQSTKDNLTIDGTTGKLSATSAEFTTITIKGKTHFTETAYIGINVTPNSAYDLYVDGRTYLKGHIGIGTAPTATTSEVDLKVNGQTWILGNLGIGTSPSASTANNAYTLKVSGDTYISGKIGIGTTSEDDYSVTLGGGIYIKGDVRMSPSSNLQCHDVGDNPTWMQFASNGVFCRGNLMSFNCDYVQFTEDGETVTFNRRVQLWTPDETVLYCPGTTNADAAGYVTLAQYIKNNSGSWFNINVPGDGEVATSTYARYLASDNKGTKYSVGSTTCPVYFSDGIPVAISTGSAGQYLATYTDEDNNLSIGWKTPVQAYYPYAPDSKGHSGQAWMGNATDTNDEGPSWQSTWHSHTITLYQSATGLLYAEQNDAKTLTAVSITVNGSYV